MKNKIFIFLTCILLFCVLGLPSKSVYASDRPSFDISLIKDTDYKYFITYYLNDSYTTRCFTVKPYAVVSGGQFYLGSSETCTILDYRYKNGLWVAESNSVTVRPGDWLLSGGGFLVSNLKNVIVDSSFDIHYKNSDEVFFYKPTIIQIVSKRIVIKSILSEVVSLLPLLISLLASWIALRKGLHFLKNLLRQA